MPVITEETAHIGEYSALVTSVDMMLLLIEREVCADDTDAVNNICRMAAITGELETGYKGCYIAVKGEPNRGLVQWRKRVRESIRGADTKEKVEGEVERLCTCAGTTAEWLRQRVDQEQTQAKRMEEFARGGEDKDNLTFEDEPEATAGAGAAEDKTAVVADAVHGTGAGAAEDTGAGAVEDKAAVVADAVHDTGAGADEDTGAGAVDVNGTTPTPSSRRVVKEAEANPKTAGNTYDSPIAAKCNALRSTIHKGQVEVQGSKKTL